VRIVQLYSWIEKTDENTTNTMVKQETRYKHKSEKYTHTNTQNTNWNINTYKAYWAEIVRNET